MNERNSSSRLREEFDADTIRDTKKASKFETAFATHKVICSECAGKWFVDDELFLQVLSAFDVDPANNPFICEECAEEIDEFSHAH
jgi:hypothetical protein